MMWEMVRQKCQPLKTCSGSRMVQKSIVQQTKCYEPFHLWKTCSFSLSLQAFFSLIHAWYCRKNLPLKVQFWWLSQQCRGEPMSRGNLQAKRGGRRTLGNEHTDGWGVHVGADLFGPLLTVHWVLMRSDQWGRGRRVMRGGVWKT